MRVALGGTSGSGAGWAGEVAADQRSFVAPNAVSIAEAHFTPGHWMRAIYAEGQPVGFVLTFDEPSEGYSCGGS